MQTSIRGLSPQAGGFRRRPNRPSSVGRSSRCRLTHCPQGRLPCATASVYQAPAVPYNTPIRGSLSTPDAIPRKRNAQYNTNRPYMSELSFVGFRVRLQAAFRVRRHGGTRRVVASVSRRSRQRLETGRETGATDRRQAIRHAVGVRGRAYAPFAALRRAGAVLSAVASAHWSGPVKKWVNSRAGSVLTLEAK